MDRALLEAEEKYHSVFDHLVEGIFQTTPEGRYLMANAALARIYGYASPEELIQGLTDIGRRLYVEEGRREEFIRLMQEHDTLTGFESPIYRKDGSVIWISENCRAVRDARGRLLYYEGTVEDITQQRAGGGAAAQFRGALPFAGRDAAAEYLSQGPPGALHLRQPAVLQDPGPAPGGDCRQDGLRLLPARAGGEVPAGRPASDADRQALRDGRGTPAAGRRARFMCRWSRRRCYGADGAIIGLQGIFWDITQQRHGGREDPPGQRRCWPKAARSSAPRTRRWRTTCKMAREIQVTMLPQQYPAFPRSALALRERLPIHAPVSARGHVSGAISSPSPRCPRTRRACSSATSPGTASARRW